MYVCTVDVTSKPCEIPLPKWTCGTSAGEPWDAVCKAKHFFYIFIWIFGSYCRWDASLANHLVYAHSCRACLLLTIIAKPCSVASFSSRALIRYWYADEAFETWPCLPCLKARSCRIQGMQGSESKTQSFRKALAKYNSRPPFGRNAFEHLVTRREASSFAKFEESRRLFCKACSNISVSSVLQRCRTFGDTSNEIWMWTSLENICSRINTIYLTFLHPKAGKAQSTGPIPLLLLKIWPRKQQGKYRDSALHRPRWPSFGKIHVLFWDRLGHLELGSELFFASLSFYGSLLSQELSSTKRKSMEKLCNNLYIFLVTGLCTQLLRHS